MTRDFVGLMLMVVVVFAVLTILVGGERVLHYATLPFFLNQETAAYDQSRAVVETKRDLLLRLQADYLKADADQGQKQAIVNRMRETVATLPPDAVPAATSRFLAGK